MTSFSDAVTDLSDFNLWALRTCDKLLDDEGDTRDKRAKFKILTRF
jgi:hypothetical protein